eukprot:s2004_g10.t1
MDCRNLSFDVILSYARFLVLLYNAGRVRLRPEFTVTQSRAECIRVHQAIFKSPRLHSRSGIRFVTRLGASHSAQVPSSVRCLQNTLLFQ